MKTNFDANLLNLKLYTINTILEINTYHYHLLNCLVLFIQIQDSPTVTLYCCIKQSYNKSSLDHMDHISQPFLPIGGNIIPIET